MRFTTRLQARHPGWSGPQAEREIVQRVIDAINGPWDRHQLLGNPEVVQEDPRRDDEVALLHLAPDEALGFEFLDGGDILVCGPREALRQQRWNRLTWWPSSC